MATQARPAFSRPGPSRPGLDRLAKLAQARPIQNTFYKLLLEKQTKIFIKLNQQRTDQYVARYNFTKFLYRFGDTLHSVCKRPTPGAEHGGKRNVQTRPVQAWPIQAWPFQARPVQAWPVQAMPFQGTAKPG